MNNNPPTRRDFIKTTALTLPLLAAGCYSLSNPTASASDFVTIRNRRFERRGQPYCFIGANFPQAAMAADSNLPGGRERVVRELDQLHSIGVTNLRVMAGSEGSQAAGEGVLGFVMKPGQWNEELLRGLDFVIVEMAKRDMTGVFYLTNYWEWSGGMAVYVNWATGESIPDPNQRGVENPGAAHMTYAARFYGLPLAQQLFQEYITQVLNRHNTINGRFYHEDPTIMSWQLSNEPRPGTDASATEANLPAFFAWMDETARFIKTRAPRQLVSTGNEGTIGCIGKADAYLKAHQSSAVDYATMHLWVKNWGWLKEPRLGPQYEEATARAMRYIDQHIARADQLGKPLVMEEFGIDRDDASTDPDSPTAMRDDFYNKMFQGVFESCKTKGALQGTNFWVWSGEGSNEAIRQRRKGNQQFREAVDENGVLETDRSTLAVIRQQSTRLEGLAG
jgi:mannan endo-1,4-beta-mannosidase